MRSEINFRRGSTLIAMAFTLVGWQCCASMHLLNVVILPTPIEVFRSLCVIMTTPRELHSVRATVVRAIQGVIYSLLIGVPAGALLSYYRKVFAFIDWSIELVRAIPPAVVLPLFFFASSQGGADNDAARIRLVCFGCLPILVMQITETARKVPNERLEFAKLIGASSIFIIRRVLAYEILPNVFIALRTILSFAIVIVVVTEMIYPPELGIGSRIQEWQRDYGSQFVYAYALIAGGLGIIANQCSLLIERKLIYWRP